MARISQIQRGIRRSDEKLAMYAALLSLLVVLDEYYLKKDNTGKVSITVCKSIFKETFTSKDEYGLIKPLGDWLCKLPKTIWETEVK
jgi:hypothetical protein